MTKLLTLGLAAILSASFALPVQADDRRGNYGGYHNKRNDHDWKKGQHWHRDDYPRRVHVRPQPRAVYYYPQPTYYYPTTAYYSSSPHFIQTFPSHSTTIITRTGTPLGYTPSYIVGGYLPQTRTWRPLPDYVRYGLPAPRRGERWMGNRREAVLISEATSRIVSGILLAASID